jgi:hypothetical protein
MRPDGTDNRPIADNVVARLRALRAEYPDAQVSTELIRLDDAVAVVRAAIVLPGGGSASAFGTFGVGGHEAVEEAESRALDRSLAVLGYGQVAPQQVASPAGGEQPAREPASSASEEPAERPAPKREPVPERETAREAASRQAAPAAPAVAPSPVRPAAVATDDDPPLEDYSWTAFWNWARKLGYQNKVAVEELIGQSITSLSPAQVRNLIREKTGAE